MIYPGLPVAIERQPGIVQRRYQVASDIPDVAGVIVHSFQNILDVASVQLQERTFYHVMRDVFAVTRIVGLVEQIASTIMLISSLMVSALPGFCSMRNS